MARLNQFLRKCVGTGVDFRRISFVRLRHHPEWSDYFPVGEPRTLTKVGSNTFEVSERCDVGKGFGKDWVCTKTAGDVELLSINLSWRGIVVTLGDGYDDFA